MQLILSKKGFDTSCVCGQVPSPIFENNEMISLPITGYLEKEKGWDETGVTYNDLILFNHNFGKIANDIGAAKCGNKVDYCQYPTHHDPDLLFEIRKNRKTNKDEWQPTLGQAKSALSHILKQCFPEKKRNENLLFLFYGLFQKVELKNDKYVRVKNEKRKNVIWGWLQVNDYPKELPTIEDNFKDEKGWPAWLQEHPHVISRKEALRKGDKLTNPNAIFIGDKKKKLFLPIDKNGKMEETSLPSAGIFTHFRKELQLTDIDQSSRITDWRLPCFFDPSGKDHILTWHSKKAFTKRENDDGYVNFKKNSICQESILYCDEYFADEEIRKTKKYNDNPWLYDVGEWLKYIFKTDKFLPKY